MKQGHFFVLEPNLLNYARLNARAIVKFSSAYPFRLPRSEIMCVICNESFAEAMMFRKHMDEEHVEFNPEHAFTHLSHDHLKLDITNMCCRICNLPFRDLQNFAKHLVEIHSKKLNFDTDLGIQPFLLENGKFVCPICEFKAKNICSLSKHVQTHYRSYICENCGKSYAVKSSLQFHVRNQCTNKSNDGLKRCRKCKDVISSLEEHLATSESCGRYVCNICGKRFSCYDKRQAHMAKVHVSFFTYPCPECDIVFFNRTKFRNHYNVVHTDDYLCSHCGVKFGNKYKLDRHLKSHVGRITIGTK